MQKKIFARSNQNGINFYSNVLMGTTLKAYFGENDEFKSEMVFPGTSSKEILEDSTKLSDETKKKIKKRGLIIGIPIMLLAISTLELMIGLAAMYFFLSGIKELLEFIETIKIFRKKDSKGQSIAQFHAAKNKVLNAYETLGNKIPTLEETKKASQFSELCENLPLIRKVAHGITFPVVLSLSTLNLPIYLSAIAIYAVLYFLELKFSYLRVFECFLLSKPTDKQIALAIEGLREWESMENTLDKEFENGGALFRFEDSESGIIMQVEMRFGENKAENTSDSEEESDAKNAETCNQMDNPKN